MSLTDGELAASSSSLLGVDQEAVGPGVPRCANGQQIYSLSWVADVRSDSSMWSQLCTAGTRGLLMCHAGSEYIDSLLNPEDELAGSSSMKDDLDGEG